MVCYCAALSTLETRTRVVILQHPRERDMAIGTARMASLCLPQAQLHVGVRWDAHPALARALGDPARPPILLYPGEGARDILREPPADPVTLVVVDGTWSQARSVVRDNPVLRALPRYAFETPEPSQYRIRREPRAEYVSTIEALMYVLGALEGDPARFRALLAPLHAMVDAQLAAQARSPRQRVRVPHPPRARDWAMPDAVTTRFADLVLAVGETNAWPYTDQPPGGDELVQWAALRPATGEVFDMVCAPRRGLAPSTTFHSELPAALISEAPPPAELLAAYAAFARPSDVLAAWGSYGPERFVEAGGALPADCVDLRAVAKRLEQKKLGGLEDYAAQFPAGPALAVRGRAGRRLAMVAAIVAAWRVRAGVA